jgi:ankyrin repeat protein
VGGGASLDIVQWIGDRTGSDESKALRGFAGRTLLHDAVLNGHVHLMKYLLSIDPEAVNVQDTWGRTPIEWARQKAMGHAVAMMIEHKLRREKMIKTVHESSLKWQNTSIDHVEAFLKKDPKAVVRRGGTYREYPIYYAIAYGAPLGVVEFIGRHTGKTRMVEWKDDTKCSLLHHAASNKKSQHLVPYLIFASPGSCVSKDKRGRIPLDLAKHHKLGTATGHLENPVATLDKFKHERNKRKAKASAESGQKHRIRYGHMINSLHAIGKKWATTSVDLVQELVEREGEGALQKQEHSNRPIFNAVRWGATEAVVRWMCERVGVEVVKTWRYNTWTLLHCAASDNSPHLIPYLLSDVDDESLGMEDSWGRTPLDWAAIKGNKACHQLLENPSKTLKEYKDCNQDVNIIMQRFVVSGDCFDRSQANPRPHTRA